jgi:hypothetical protein
VSGIAHLRAVEYNIPRSTPVKVRMFLVPLRGTRSSLNSRRGA